MDSAITQICDILRNRCYQNTLVNGNPSEDLGEKLVFALQSLLDPCEWVELCDRKSLESYILTLDRRHRDVEEKRLIFQKIRLLNKVCRHLYGRNRQERIKTFTKVMANQPNRFQRLLANHRARGCKRQHITRQELGICIGNWREGVEDEIEHVFDCSGTRPTRRRKRTTEYDSPYHHALRPHELQLLEIQQSLL